MKTWNLYLGISPRPVLAEIIPALDSTETFEDFSEFYVYLLTSELNLVNDFGSELDFSRLCSYMMSKDLVYGKREITRQRCS